ncbi:hypothetical protein [Demequina maris]|uniref:hypothetical protein n=1 Tax=Demequina maris TaxID=1638982 RepID=UPI0034E2D6C6
MSADADVLISPEGVEELCAALAGCGWLERPSGDPAGLKPEHSITLIHPAWPCDIDMHVYFPGFLAPAQAVFDMLWARRQSLALAGVEVDIVDRSSAILIAALHALRTPVQTPRHAQEIRGLVDTVLPSMAPDEVNDLVALAGAAGAIDSARPMLDRLSVELPPPLAHGENPTLDAWRARVGGHGEVLGQWMPVLRRARWRDRPALVARVIWPSASTFRASHPDTPPGWGATVRGRWARVGRGLRAAPRVVRGRWLARRGTTDASILIERARWARFVSHV